MRRTPSVRGLRGNSNGWTVDSSRTSPLKWTPFLITVQDVIKKKKKNIMDESKHQRERIFSPHFCRRPNRPPLFWCPSSSQCLWFDMLSPLDWRLGFCRICSQWGQMCPWNRWSDPGREFDPWRMPLALSVSRKNVQIIKYTFPRTPKRRFTRVDSTESIRKAISCVLK